MHSVFCKYRTNGIQSNECSNKINCSSTTYTCITILREKKCNDFENRRNGHIWKCSVFDALLMLDINKIKSHLYMCLYNNQQVQVDRKYLEIVSMSDTKQAKNAFHSTNLCLTPHERNHFVFVLTRATLHARLLVQLMNTYVEHFHAFHMCIRDDCQCFWPQWNLIRILGDIWFTRRAHSSHFSCTFFLCVLHHLNPIVHRGCIHLILKGCIWSNLSRHHLQSNCEKKPSNGAFFVSNLCNFIEIETIKGNEWICFSVVNIWNWCYRWHSFSVTLSISFKAIQRNQVMLQKPSMFVHSMWRKCLFYVRAQRKNKSEFSDRSHEKWRRRKKRLDLPENCVRSEIIL